MSEKILSQKSVEKLRKVFAPLVDMVEEVVTDTMKEKSDQLIEVKVKLEKAEEKLKKVEEVYSIYREIYNDDNAFICKTIEDERKLEALKRNWDNIRLEDLDKICVY